MKQQKNIFSSVCTEITDCVRRTGDILTEELQKVHCIQNAAILMQETADYLMQEYAMQGYRVQELRFEEDGIEGTLIQIRNDSFPVLNTLKVATGLKLAACVKLLPVNEDLQVTICQGRWQDKIIVNVVSWFILQPLFITSLIGIFRQKSLLDRIERDLLTFFANHTERDNSFTCRF